MTRLRPLGADIWRSLDASFCGRRARALREILENQQEITTLTVIWARRFVQSELHKAEKKNSQDL